MTDLAGWMAENDFGRDGIVWCVKRLSANDTLATNAHQAGPYLPRDFMREVFPEIDRPDDPNPDVEFDLHVDSHGDHQRARAVWYNQRSRNEVRITRLGGARSPLLDPDSTGALVVFAFRLGLGRSQTECRVWVCDSEAAEEAALGTAGWVEPGTFRFLGTPGYEGVGTERDCRLSPDEVPQDWIDNFPGTDVLLKKVVTLRPADGFAPDERLLRRRNCEFELFQSIEEAAVLPAVRQGFERMDDFVQLAQTTLQRRRSRAGRSLELHTRQILVEEGLSEHEDFSHGAESELGKRPDFLFPSKACYDDPRFPPQRLRMLAVKTTCRDRWRQVTTEADRIPVKHLLTLQAGVSGGQFEQMKDSGVRLVVPASLVASYPAEVRPELVTLGGFLGELRELRPRPEA